MDIPAATADPAPCDMCFSYCVGPLCRFSGETSNPTILILAVLVVVELIADVLSTGSVSESEVFECTLMVTRR